MSVTYDRSVVLLRVALNTLNPNLYCIISGFRHPQPTTVSRTIRVLNQLLSITVKPTNRSVLHVNTSSQPTSVHYCQTNKQVSFTCQYEFSTNFCPLLSNQQTGQFYMSIRVLNQLLSITVKPTNRSVLHVNMSSQPTSVHYCQTNK